MRKTPQIPGDIFFGRAPEPPPSVPAEVAAPAEVPAPAPAEPPPAPATIAAPPPPAAEEKLQVTIYLTPRTVRQLEALRFHLLTDYNVKVSKSAIAEYALNSLGDDLAPLADFFAMGES